MNLKKIILAFSTVLIIGSVSAQMTVTGGQTVVQLVTDVIVGGGRYAKPARVPVPAAVVTDTEPDAPAATVALMLVALTTVNVVAAVPPKLTAVAPVKFVPIMLTT